MTPWTLRSSEERALLNPAFLGILLWYATRGYAALGNARPFSFQEAFLILPLVLDREIRELLPRTTRTSLATWLEENPLARPRILPRARLLVPFTKEALLFASRQRLLALTDSQITADESWRRVTRRLLKDCTDEVRQCAVKAEFLGKWLASAGTRQTIFVLFGLRP